ncbi:tol-pal system YbgF family protein [Pendulispora albinea]|uniref:Tetratricopeptide repeat protein n=1 Tax=Pendulispora albinea TaxID=2741071 RepID=A0ABZ2M0J9_9BACT
MLSPFFLVSFLFLTLLASFGCSAHAPTPAKEAVSPPLRVRVPTQVVTPTLDGSEKELFERGERALLGQRWREAADIFETLIRLPPEDALHPAVLFDLGSAYEGLEVRDRARDSFSELARRFPRDKLARPALLRGLALSVYLEEWKALGDGAEVLLARDDLDPVDRMTGLGARGLARIEQGDDARAMIDVQNGLDLVEEHRYGMTGRLPTAASQLKFALGEIRRVRSERVQFVNPLPSGELPSAAAVSPDFLSKMEARCQGLLDAQAAYGDAMRSIDAHWIAMSGYRVGEMYRRLHHDLMLIPPTLLTKTDKQKSIFYAIMHLRYRVLLEKGLEMTKRTLVIGEKQLDSSAWVRRAEEMKRQIEQALEEEKAVFAGFPFTEAEVQGALDIMKKKAEKQRASGKVR